MDKEIFIVRHGRTAYNKMGIWQGSGVDASLDEKGKEQAELFYKYYREEDFDLIIHSSLRRAKETVEPFIRSGINSHETSDINEISWGIHEGKPHTEESYAEYKRVITAWSVEHYHIGFKGGESASDLMKRMNRFRDYLEQLDKQRVLICSHGRAIRALLCTLRGEPYSDMEKYEHANTGLFKALYSGGHFYFNDFNNTDHLAGSV